jgi:protein-disulfide isomerase
MAKRSQERRTGGSQSTSRSRTRARRDARLAEERNRRRFMMVAGIVVAVAVAFLIIFLVTRPQEAPLPEGLFERYAGIPQTFDTDGFPMLGDPDAPVRVIEYSSFSCPSCLTWHEDHSAEVIEHIRAGEISFTYVPLQTGSIPNAEGAAKVALCAGQQGLFFEMHDALFAWQSAYGNRAFTQQRLSSGIENFDLNANAYSNCRGGSAVSAQLETAEAIATDRGVNSTPSFSVQGNLLSNDDDLFDVIAQTLQNYIATTGIEPVPLDLQNEAEATSEAEATAEVEITAEVTETEEVTPEVTESVETTETPTP